MHRGSTNHQDKHVGGRARGLQVVSEEVDVASGVQDPESVKSCSCSRAPDLPAGPTAAVCCHFLSWSDTGFWPSRWPSGAVTRGYLLAASGLEASAAWRAPGRGLSWPRRPSRDKEGPKHRCPQEFGDSLVRGWVASGERRGRAAPRPRTPTALDGFPRGLAGPGALPTHQVASQAWQLPRDTPGDTEGFGALQRRAEAGPSPGPRERTERAASWPDAPPAPPGLGFDFGLVLSSDQWSAGGEPRPPTHQAPFPELLVRRMDPDLGWPPRGEAACPALAGVLPCAAYGVRPALLGVLPHSPVLVPDAFCPLPMPVDRCC